MKSLAPYNRLPEKVSDFQKQFSIEVLKEQTDSMTLRQAISMKAFSLLCIEQTYGVKMVKLFLSAMLIELNNFNGSQMDNSQIMDLARLIFKRDSTVNIYELAYFMDNVKLGTYGRFYGSNIKPIDLMEMYQTFLQTRCDLRYKIQQEQEQIRREQEYRLFLQRRALELEECKKYGVKSIIEVYYIKLKPEEVKTLPESEKKKYEKFIKNYNK